MAAAPSLFVRMLRAVLLLLPAIVWGQENTKVATDSSVIDTRYFPDLNSMRVFNELKSEDKTFFQDYFLDSKVLHREGVFVRGKSFGIWKEYAPDGSLARVIDHDQRVWRVDNKERFPYFDIQEKAKRRGDSLITAIYGARFLDKHARWNIDGSYVYNGRQSGSWDDSIGFTPKRFFLSYDITLDTLNLYESMIEFELDSVGNFIPNPYARIYGFEKRPSKTDTFQLTYPYAVDVAEQHGLIETDSTRALGFFKWEGNESSELYNGRYHYYLMQHFNRIVRPLEKQGHHVTVDYYYVWSFDPWSGQFKERKEMEQVSTWEGGHGNRTELRDSK